MELIVKLSKMGEMNITYETLFELLRREKNREDLQEIESSFFNDVLNYLKEKEKQLAELQTKNDMFAAEEIKKTAIQNDNIQKIIRELYERREKKIINMALDKSRAKESVIDESMMLEEEKELYNQLLGLMNNFRESILYNLLQAKEIGIKVEQTQEEEESTAIKIKVTEFIPKFIGSDLKEYGPFENEDNVELPRDVADLLIEKGSA